jgi:anti-sigma factor RsiW
LDVSVHGDDRLALRAARSLDPEEEARVEAHLRECPACAAAARSWQALADGLRELEDPRPGPGPALRARTRDAVERRLAARTEQAWNRAALGFLIVFGWTLTGVAWIVLDLVLGQVAARLERPLGSTALWFAGYLAVGWVTAATAALLLGRHAPEEGRMA